MIKKIFKGITNPRLAWNHLTRKKREWEEEDMRDLSYKKYDTYNEYLAHQKSKLQIGDLKKDSNTAFTGELKERLQNKAIPEGSRVICLAARLGDEVRAFKEMGCFAIGIDLYPGKENKDVVYGDFHDVPFPDKCTDFIFTNSMDHSFDLPRLISEMDRLLVDRGRIIVEVYEEDPGDYYESVKWGNLDVLIKQFEYRGFKEIHREKVNDRGLIQLHFSK